MSVFYYSRDTIIITALDGTIVGVNAAFSAITGYTADEVRGPNPRILRSGRQDRAFYVSMWQTVKSQAYWQGEEWNRRKDGSLCAERITICSVPDAAMYTARRQLRGGTRASDLGASTAPRRAPEPQRATAP